jgi:hypothetical protein
MEDIMTRKSLWIAALGIVALGTLLHAAAATAEILYRSNDIQSGDIFNENAGQAIGDLWTFKCGGGFVRIDIDSNADQDLTGGSPTLTNLDLGFVVFDGSGAVINGGDDEVACSVTPECGFGCPSTTGFIACGPDPHSIRVYNVASSCSGGGQYNMEVEVLDAGSNPVDGKKVKLGGGSKRKLPGWADPTKQNGTGPALDDELVP